MWGPGRFCDALPPRVSSSAPLAKAVEREGIYPAPFRFAPVLDGGTIPPRRMHAELGGTVDIRDSHAEAQASYQRIYDRDPEHVIVTHDGLNFWVGCKIDAKPGQPLQLIEISLHGFDCPERLPILLSLIDAPDQKRSSGVSAKRSSMNPSRGPLPVLLINTPGVEARQPHARGWLG